MNKLYVFGCSHSAVHSEKLNSNPYMKEYYEYRGGNFPPTWSELLAKDLKLRLVNTAEWGLDNYRIFEAFCNRVVEMERGDTVIIGWTGVSRFSLYSETFDTLLSVNAWTGNTGNELTDISRQTIDEILVNRSHPRWTEEVHSWMKAINKLSKVIGFKLYFWSFFDEFPELNIIQDVFKSGGEYITNETNNKVVNNHLGEKGHIAQARCLKDMLEKKY